jgi:hypothetical protein
MADAPFLSGCDADNFPTLAVNLLHLGRESFVGDDKDVAAAA